jgi:MFS superfamily sulfate permease-like transporter
LLRLARGTTHRIASWGLRHLFPLAIGYIAVCGLDPAGFLVMMGLANIATSALIKKYWPDRPVSESRLALNMGVMNLALPFFGGMPLCHGAGGLAGQYYFGARTGGTNLIEGTIEVGLGLFLAGSIASLFTAFPSAIIGAMMLLVGVELVKFARDLRWSLDLVPLAATVTVSILTNMAFGFAAGTAVHYSMRSFQRTK